MTDITINDGGVRGFLKWFRSQQPGLYAEVARHVSQKVPGAFNDYHAGNWKIAGLGQSEALQQLSLDPSLVKAPTVDVSDAADAGSSTSSITDTISNIVKGISTLYMTKKQADIQQQVVNTQLARAAAGLPPLPQNLANLGVPQVNVGLQSGTGTWLAVGGGLLLLAILFGRRRSAR